MKPELNNVQKRELKRFLKPTPGSKRKLVAIAKATGSGYAAILEFGKNSAGEILVVLPPSGNAHVLLADTTLLPLERRLVPPLVRKELTKGLRRAAGRTGKAGAKGPIINQQAVMHGFMRVLAD